MEALSDKKFDDNAVNKEFPSINESSWRERERIYTLQKEEQDLIIIYRTLQEEQKEKVFEFIQTMKKQNQDKPRSEIKTEE